MKDVDAFSNFKRTVRITVWRKHRAEKDNYLCDGPNCHSICDGSRFLQRSFQTQCAKCTHPHSFHSYTRHTWAEEVGTQTLVDEDMKMKWEVAKAEKEFITTKETRLAQLNLDTRQDTDDLVRLVEVYARVSLEESFSIHMEKAIRLYRDMEKEINKEQSTGRLGIMKWKLKLLTRAENEAQKKARTKENKPHLGHWNSGAFRP